MLFLLWACAPLPRPQGDLDSPGPQDTGAPLDTADPGPTEPPSEPPPIDVPAPVPGTCTLGPHSRSFTLQVPFRNGVRTALVDLPSGYDGSTDLPVVLSFHGLVMDAQAQRLYTGLHLATNNRGWIAVHPEAAPEWNVLPGSPDVAFVDALLDTLETTVCVDARRVYSTGMSQGAHVSYMLGCTLPGRIAAIAPVAGSDFNVFCDPGLPVPNLHIHGTSDLIVSYNGGILYDDAPTVVADWARQINGCQATSVETLQQGDVTCRSRSCSGQDEATLCSVQGGGHTWPGAAPLFFLGNTSNAIVANQMILDFFARYTR